MPTIKVYSSSFRRGVSDIAGMNRIGIEEYRSPRSAFDVMSFGQVVFFDSFWLGGLGAPRNDAEGMGRFVDMGQIENN